MHYIILLVLAMIICHAEGQDDYCDVSCNNGGDKHVMCTYKERNQDGMCSELSGVMTKEVRQILLDMHNELRNKVAKGQESGQPPAANMNTLNWDAELEMFAQRWADQCQDGHDKCHNTKEQIPFSLVNQNAAGPMGGDEQTVAKEGVRMWYKEVEKANLNRNTTMTVEQLMEGKILHYTQVVWADTEKIGCGMSKFIPNGNDVYKSKLVCNYKISGNMPGREIYKIGDACSECGNKQCNSKYDGLCGEIEEPPSQVDPGY